MLCEFAITPWTFDPANGSGPNAFDLSIGCLDDLCREEGMFWDLRNGSWSRVVDGVSPRAKVFLKTIRSRRRLIPMDIGPGPEPDTDEEWLWEAQAVHGRSPCKAIITTNALALAADDADVVAIERLNSTQWWTERSASKTVQRRTQDYREACSLMFQHANLVMFIDPYINPQAENYAEFPQLLLAACSNGHHPVIEIHRQSFGRQGGQNVVKSIPAWMADFEPWSRLLEHAEQKAEVFLWEDLHNRHLVTDIAAVNFPYGFDIGDVNEAPTELFRESREVLVRLQTEFDPACPLHRLAGRFEIGKTT